MGRLIGSEEFGHMLASGFRRAFRLEAQKEYAIGSERSDFQRFLDGNPVPPPDVPWWKQWLDQVARSAEAGRTMSRVRVVEEPPTPYQEFGRWAASWHVAAGEDIRYLSRSAFNRLGIPADDWWLLDDKLILMHYTSSGAIEGRELVTDKGIVALHREWQDLAVRHSIPAAEATAALHEGSHQVVQSTKDWLTQPGGLATRLTQLRTAAGLTGDQLTERLGWTSRSKVPKLENGRQIASANDLAEWVEATGSQDQLDELLELREAARAHHVEWKKQLKQPGGQAGVQKSFDDLVRGGELIRSVQVTLVPGLLQTPEYVRYRALDVAQQHGSDPEKVDEVVAARMRRQDVLYDTSKRFEFIILEAVLHHLLCPPEVMIGQYYRLQSVIGMPNIRFGIVPFGKVLKIAPMAGFLMVDDVAVVESYSGVDRLEGDESLTYGKVMEDTWPDAVEGDDARQILTRAADLYRPH